MVTITHKNKSTVAVTNAKASSAGAVVPLLLCCCYTAAVVLVCTVTARLLLKFRGSVGFYRPAAQHPICWPALEITFSFLLPRTTGNMTHTCTHTEAPPVTVTKGRA